MPPSPARVGRAGSNERRTRLALAATVPTAAALPVYMSLLENPFSRSTGWPLFALGVLGVGLAIYAAWHDRRRWVRGLAGVQIGVLAFFFVAFFMLFSLPKPASAAGQLALAPNFTLLDHNQRPVELAPLLQRGPALLVFYRGHW
ncbi:MAG: hypothetical protein AB7Q17_04005 [Phycisphaerae bacterium]